MKHLLLIFVTLITVGGLSAQQVKRDSAGNYVSMKATRQGRANASGKTYTDSKGKVYPVFVSANGKLFVRKTSKKGNEYNYYLKVN